MYNVILISFAIASISLALTKSAMFEFVREYAEKHFPTLLAELFQCHFCMNHWVSFGFLFFISDYFMVSFNYVVITYFVNFFVFVGVSTACSGILNHFLIQPDKQVDFLKKKLEHSKELIRKLSGKTNQ